ncbi:polyprenyl synthetase family protein [Pontiella sulfatireligans]|uniref:Farnesyl diphosphate synthase n=1 Tax=Pontiella sulfatireligans TaxID=2750658 RepID=A0A6C2UUK9_9BACT|nr:farnesyl diphosphate synthase [Pontiella sulfatireligans]VGO23041.1 Farnesyl diphosphate synthase [Pontiella sulfatireligans]
MTELSRYLNEKQALMDTALKDCLPAEGTRPAVLHQAMRYCVLNGGKRIRPILCIAVAETFGTRPKAALAAAVAVELFHCSTLVHDDLPCMDDDDLRRGMPTCHVKYGEANAVLTGDALMIHAFHILAESGSARLSLELAKAAGSMGVIAGQVEDLDAEGKKPNAGLIEFIHMNKTAILIRAAVRMGALVGGAAEDELETLSLFSEKIGLAFQIEDDILDETSTDEVLGKPAGSDAEQHKMTYPAVHGMDVAAEKVRSLTSEAVGLLNMMPRNTHILRSIAEYLVSRRS